MSLHDLYLATMSDQPISNLQKTIALELVRRYAPCYASIEAVRVCWRSKCIILVPLGDECGRFCLNKQSSHNSSTVYFFFYIS